jgi:hypothetical protein
MMKWFEEEEEEELEKQRNYSDSSISSLILASVTSNNHTHMVFADVMSTFFADKMCLHICTPAAYVTAPSLSWYRLVVFRVLHSVFFRIRDKPTHDYCCFDVPR